jgi:hypothetical protein
MRSKETFVLSLWIEEGEKAVLRGLLQNVKSGEKQPFADAEQLLALLKAWLLQEGAIPNENEAVQRRDG